MNRRAFVRRTLTGGALLGTGVGASAPGSAAQAPVQDVTQDGDLFVERDRPGRPHAGKVLAAIQPHADDIPIIAGGVVTKLLREGYTGYLIQTSNDEKAGPGTVGECMLANEVDVQNLARTMGFKEVFNLEYRNHRMDGISRLELRGRLVFLFRLLKVDTIICYDPWGHYEENPDHYVTAQCAEAACWMAGMRKDYPEHFAAGLEPQSVREKYYFARGPQLVNRIVDISSFVEEKIDANLTNVAQGPSGATGRRLRARLAAEGRRLPLLGDDDRAADREYTRQFVLARNRELGRRHGVEYAEAYHYIGPRASAVDAYVEQHAVPL